MNAASFILKEHAGSVNRGIFRRILCSRWTLSFESITNDFAFEE